jgi:gamma-carbonic anhydrase
MTEQRVRTGRNVFIAPTAYVGGNVTLGDSCTVMHHVTIRGDIAAITIGRRVNIQDGAVVHIETGVDLEIADDVGVGHRAVVHCRSIGRGTLIGIGSIVLDGCVIGQDCIIAAGAVLVPGSRVPDGTVMMGVPAKPVRETSETDRAYITTVIASYVDLGRRHARGEFPNFTDGAE